MGTSRRGESRRDHCVVGRYEGLALVFFLVVFMFCFFVRLGWVGSGCRVHTEN